MVSCCDVVVVWDCGGASLRCCVGAVQLWCGAAVVWDCGGVGLWWYATVVLDVFKFDVLNTKLFSYDLGRDGATKRGGGGEGREETAEAMPENDFLLQVFMQRCACRSVNAEV